MKEDKKLLIRIPERIYRKMKMDSAKTDKSMNLIINEMIKNKYNK
jgi:predicted HicB family RNase H-like nuclease